MNSVCMGLTPVGGEEEMSADDNLLESSVRTSQLNTAMAAVTTKRHEKESI